MEHDSTVLAVLISVLLVSALGAEVLLRRGVLPTWLGRAIFAFLVTGSFALAPFWIQKVQTVVLMVVMEEMVFVFLLLKGRLFEQGQGGISWGIVLFPLVYLFLWVFPGYRELLIIPMSILALVPLSSIVGRLVKRGHYRITGDWKHPAGNLVFFFATLLLLFFWTCIAPEDWLINLSFSAEGIAYLLGISVMLAVIEALSSQSSENLWIPLAAASLLFPQIAAPVGWDKVMVLWGVGILALGFARFALRRGSLSLSGAIMTALLGVWIALFSGPAWLLLPLFFFGSSTLIGRMEKSGSMATDKKHGKGRDLWQVLYNGGMYGVLATFAAEGPRELIFTLMTVTLAVSTSDTWSSEWGILFRGKTWDILRWKRVPPGLSGGVSLAGTLAGLLGALCLALLGSLLLWKGIHPGFVLWVTLAGFSGMLLDSVLGAGLQARFLNRQTGQWSDTGTERVSGLPWMSNDLVNLLSNAVVTAGAAMVFGWPFL